MTRKNLITLGFIFGITFGYFLFKGQSSQNPQEVVMNRNVDDRLPQREESRTLERPDAHRAIASINETEIRSFRDSFPDKNDVKKEASLNAHRTPPSLISFAEELGSLNEKAMKNPEDARLLVNELHDCALNESVYSSSRALCLSKAEKLAVEYPELQAKVDQIRSSASSEVNKLNDRQKLLLRR